MSAWRAKVMSTSSERIVGLHGPALCSQNHTKLYDTAGIRALEQFAAKQVPAGVLMERAGLAVAQLALAMQPHATDFWIPCGPGNNGGDGYVAARYLHQWGKRATVSCLFNVTESTLPIDAKAALQAAQHAGVQFVSAPPAQFAVCIDAIFGIGQMRATDGICSHAIERINCSEGFVLSVDVPSGLNANTGQAPVPCVNAHATLTLLGLKPGLFTAEGRDHCGEIWLNDLFVNNSLPPAAHLNVPYPIKSRRHNTHKGTYGDVSIIGGAYGMSGAAFLAATAALNAGAGRVFVGLLGPSHSPPQPELMMREINDLDIAHTTVVAGCGGRTAISTWMPKILQFAQHLVLDADGLNAIAKSSELHELLQKRHPQTTVLTPHPLEAARLLACSAQEIQNNRLAAAQTLAARFNCTAVLKGSGTVIAAPGETPRINPSGNALLATAGTGDVLAGMVGACLAAGDGAFVAACQATYRHGDIADRWADLRPLTAAALCTAL
jgi:hydroxyethylthiazole kinase-like uncharacterized protein yjeF